MSTRDTATEALPEPPEFAPEDPPRGPLVWMKENLFSTPVNSVLTIVAVAVVVLFLYGILGFIFDDTRQWNSVATNLRLYMTFAYPEEQYLRVWVSLGIVMTLMGFSIAFWRGGGRVEIRQIARNLMVAGGFVALISVLAPVAVSTRVWGLAAAAALFFAGYGTNKVLGDRAKEITVPSLGIVVTFMWLVILGLWFLPIGQYTFEAGRDPENAYEPGTIALSTKLPLTIMAGLLIVAYFIGKWLRERVSERNGRLVLVFLWILSFPTILLVVLRDPAWDWERVVTVNLPITVGFIIIGGAIIGFLSNPELRERGRLISGALLIIALGSWAFPMLIKVRLLLLLLAVFALAAPTFAGDKAARRRYLIVWGGTVAIVMYFLTVAETASTLDIQAKSFLGGLLLTFVLAISGIFISFPIGVLMALGRTSSMPIFRLLSTIYIEVVRGIPFITVLIFADIILELFLPEGLQLDDVVQAIAATALFSAAYLAENVRGGLQSVQKGQYEASNALGMTTLQTTTLIVLPQALRAVIPALVGQTIAIFKDTSLVAIIGLLDFLFIASKVVSTQTAFLGARRENLLFVAFGYWIFTFTFSRASQRLERKLGLGER